MWIPERVWEQTLTSDLVAAGIQYTLLDDFHFKNAGLVDDQLWGYYLTEDHGYVLRVFPGSERLRYLIPFRQPHETIDYLREVAHARPGAVVVFGDDGEKFGSWPETHQHVYQNGWLREFFQALADNQQWIISSTLSEAMTGTGPLGTVYLPDSSYREMTEWALPVERQQQFEQVAQELIGHPQWDRLRSFLRGGYWRNFKVKYPETGEMYSRMMQVSRRLQRAEQEGVPSAALEDARRELYRGQCNCSYWHGAFGGVYLPHLRNAVYNHLIAADNLLDHVLGRPAGRIEAVAGDYNFDGRAEVLLANEKLFCYLSPAQGGRLYELDVRSICHNLLATLARRPEIYHDKIVQGGTPQSLVAASIQDRVIFKQEGLDRHLIYDRRPRKSLVDSFYDPDVSLDPVVVGQAADLGDFAEGEYEARIRRKPDRVQVQLQRDGHLGEYNVRVIKGITLESSQSVVEIAYLLENLPADRRWRFAVEMNFAGLPAEADDRFFYQHDPQHRLGQLQSRLELTGAYQLGLADQWLGIHLLLQTDRPTDFWTYPVATVSQSEGGVELVHQSVVVVPNWIVEPDCEGRWSVTMRLHVDTSLAESRVPAEPSMSTSVL
jgi:alpha-amylase